MCGGLWELSLFCAALTRGQWRRYLKNTLAFRFGIDRSFAGHCSKSFMGLIGISLGLCMSAVAHGQQMPPPAPIPAIPPTRPEDTLTMQDPESFPEVKMDFPIAAGPFQPTWDSINEKYPGDPAWLRQAKFGIWVHFGPQSAGESGDWYARKMYQPGTTFLTTRMRRLPTAKVNGGKAMIRGCSMASTCVPTRTLPTHNSGLRRASSQNIWNTRTGTPPGGHFALWT